MAGALASVVVPAFNHDRYIERALESVADQSYAAIELIVVDDGSTDGTADAVERWKARPGAARRFRGIRLVRNRTNLGAHASLNLGLSLAGGEFLCLLNSDDWYAPTRIAVMVERMERERARFGFSAVMPVDAEGRRTLATPLARRILTAREEIAALPSVSFGFVFRQLAVSTGNFVIHRSLHEEVGAFAPYRYCHDWDYALRAFLRAEPVFVDEYLYCYRIHESNAHAALDALARRETEAVLGNYYRLCLGTPAANGRAPTPHNWPGVFEHYIDFFELGSLWNRVLREMGVPERYPVATLGPARLSRYTPVDDDEAGASLGASVRQALGSLRRARERGWRNVPRVMRNAVRLWWRAGSR